MKGPAGRGYETVPYILNCSNNLPYWKMMSEMVSPEGAICLVASTKAKLDWTSIWQKVFGSTTS